MSECAHDWRNLYSGFTGYSFPVGKECRKCGDQEPFWGGPEGREIFVTHGGKLKESNKEEAHRG